MIYWNGKIENCCFVKNDITTLHNICQLEKLEKPMFFFLTFSLDDQFEICVAILKHISLRFKYSTCLILSNGQFYIPKTLNIQIKKPKKENCGLPHLPFLVHLSVHSPN